MPPFLASKRFFSITFTALIFAVLFMHLNLHHIGRLLLDVDGVFILAAFLMFGLQMQFLAARWDGLINLNHAYVESGENRKIFFGSNLVNFVFLSSVSGPILRLVLSIRAGSPWLNALCATMVDRCLSVGTLMVAGLLALPFAFHLLAALHLSWQTLLLIGTGLTASFFVLVYLLFHPQLIKSLLGQRAFRVAWAYGSRFFSSYHWALAVLYSVTSLGAFFLGVYFIIAGLHIPITFLEMMTILPVILPILAILSSLPISIGGWGLREGSYVLGLGLLGVPMENAFLASVLVGMLTMAVSILMAAPVAFNGLKEFKSHADGQDPYQHMLAYFKRPRR